MWDVCDNLLAGESVITQKLKKRNMLNRYMTFKNIFRKKRGSSSSCRNRFVKLHVLLHLLSDGK